MGSAPKGRRSFPSFETKLFGTLELQKLGDLVEICGEHVFHHFRNLFSS